MKKISKFFPGVKAVDNVDFKLESGCIHAIVGENGAGKSTLMKIFAGVHLKDEGSIEIGGKEVNINNPSDAKRLGISIIEQEFSLFSELSVFQNIFIGREYVRRFKFVINWSKIRQKTKEIIKELGLNVNISKPIKQLTTSEQQIIEIAKSLFFGSNFIIMDEPTSSLGEEEKEKLFSIIKQLRDKNIGIIYISHRMEEIFEIADVVTVMRDGKRIGTYKISEINEQKIIKLMVGREITKVFNRNRSKAKKGKVLLEVKNLSKKDSFQNISFSVSEGEV
ncbi:ATP-binding cassette domain-containing protein, partial [Candidatus Pacearchaeota archaeon]|nr:ATP-binding cassette domain-containing protein [Candidatus Pacearchaeota archaeon]